MVGKTADGTVKKDPDYGKVRVLVYGTLKSHHYNNLVLKESGAKFLARDSVTVSNAAFIDLGGFPALVRPVTGSNKDTQTVRGEIWYGEPHMLQSCDILEGHPLFYRRSKQFSDILHRRVWVYELDEKWIAEGDDFISEHYWKPSEEEVAWWKGLKNHE